MQSTDYVEHVKDYVNATKGPWEFARRGGHTIAMEELYPVLKRDYPLNEKNLSFWSGFDLEANLRHGIGARTAASKARTRAGATKPKKSARSAE